MHVCKFVLVVVLSGFPVELKTLVWGVWGVCNACVISACGVLLSMQGRWSGGAVRLPAEY